MKVELTSDAGRLVCRPALAVSVHRWNQPGHPPDTISVGVDLCDTSGVKLIGLTVTIPWRRLRPYYLACDTLAVNRHAYVEWHPHQPLVNWRNG